MQAQTLHLPIRPHHHHQPSSLQPSSLQQQQQISSTSSPNSMQHIRRTSPPTPMSMMQKNSNSNGMVNATASAMMAPSTPSGGGITGNNNSGMSNLGFPFVGNGVGFGAGAGVGSTSYMTSQMRGGTATTPGGSGSRGSPTTGGGGSMGLMSPSLGGISNGAGGGSNAVNQSPTTNFVGSGSNNSASATSTISASSSTSGSGSGMSDAATLGAADQVHASVSHLLTRAHSLPCSTAAQAFAQLVQPTARFQLALDALLPLLDSTKSIELAQRILVSFILYSLYAPHPITINPFRSVLFVAYVKEREMAMQVADEGGTSANEQLVWVLWKILKGDGNDIGPYSPSTLARSPLPTKLRAENLVLDDEMYYSGTDLDDVTYSYFQKQQNLYGQPAPSGHNSRGTSVVTSPTIPSSAQSAAFAGITRSPITSEEDRWNERVVQGMRLLLAARERVLSIAEQRVLLPLINDVTSSRIITSLDFTPIVARNPSIAHPLFVGLLCNASDDNNNISQFLDVLSFLPPSLASMDVMGRLLHDKTIINRIPGYSTVADLVRMEVLGRFVHECINWLERAEREEKEGLISDDRFAKGVQNLCRFFSSLIKLKIIDPSSDADSAEMAHFSLRCSRFEDANALYRQMAASRY